MKSANRVWPAIILIGLSCFCSTNVEKDLEIINPPVNLQITNKTTYYEISFYAYNVEQAFQGYGIFAAADEAGAEAIAAGAEASTVAGHFCTDAASVETAYLVQVGDTTQVTGTSCYTSNSSLNGVTLATGVYITVRARVDRSEERQIEPVSRKLLLGKPHPESCKVLAAER